MVAPTRRFQGKKVDRPRRDFCTHLRFQGKKEKNKHSGEEEQKTTTPSGSGHTPFQNSGTHANTLKNALTARTATHTHTPPLNDPTRARQEPRSWGEQQNLARKGAAKESRAGATKYETSPQSNTQIATEIAKESRQRAPLTADKAALQKKERFARTGDIRKTVEPRKCVKYSESPKKRSSFFVVVVVFLTRVPGRATESEPTRCRRSVTLPAH